MFVFCVLFVSETEEIKKLEKKEKREKICEIIVESLLGRIILVIEACRWESGVLTFDLVAAFSVHANDCWCP